ncbi:MAG: GNAT family N-acetyltransferase [Pseudomonadota bacterium]
MDIRTPTRSDLAGLEQIVEKTGLFPSELLAEMLDPFWAERPDAGLWFTAKIEGRAVGFTYLAPEPMTDGTWNMRALAVLPFGQGQGLARALCRHSVRHLAGIGARLLVVDTSGRHEFAVARRFYGAIGYKEVSRIPDFWAAGDDKVTFICPL